MGFKKYHPQIDEKDSQAHELGEEKRQKKNSKKKNLGGKRKREEKIPGNIPKLKKEEKKKVKLEKQK